MTNDYGIIYELGGYTIPGSSSFFQTEAAAIKYAQSMGKKRTQYRLNAIERMKNIEITYDDLYSGGNGFIESKDIEYESDTAGGGFFQAYSGIWTNSTSNTGDYHTASRTLGWLFAHRYDSEMPGVRALIDKLKYETTDDKDPVLNYALNVLSNFSDEYWQNEYSRYEE